MEIEETVLEILLSVCGTKKALKDKDASLIENGYLDSMGIVELLTEIEDRFDIEIPIEEFDIDSFDTINKIVKYIQAKV